MPATKKKFGLTTKSLIYAIGIHAFIAVLLLVSFNFDLGKVIAPAAKQTAEPVQATVVAEADVRKQLNAIEARENKKKLEQQQAERRLQDLLLQAKAAEQKKKQEQQKLAEIKQQQAAEKKALAKKKADEKKKADALAKKKKEAELAKAKQAEEQKRKAAEKKKQAEVARKKKLEKEKREKELALKKRLEEERRQAEAARQQQMVNSALAQYIPIIKQKVSRNWNQPATTSTSAAPKVAVKLTATGEVISARVTRSSGNSMFDRSVENAVYKASPLPIPQERGVNEKFRDLNLTFRPEDLI